MSYTDINKLWEIDNEGFEKSDMSILDKRVINLWDTQCKKVNGHYELPIPWKDPEESLPNNFVLAEKQLHNLIGRLDWDKLYDRYDNEITKLLDSKYAELVPPEEIYSAKRIWYLPYHVVLNLIKPDKLCVVFYCASGYAGKYLNECCLQGPDLVNKHAVCPAAISHAQILGTGGHRYYELPGINTTS